MLEKTRGKQSVSLPDTLGLVITHIPDLLFVPLQKLCCVFFVRQPPPTPPPRTAPSLHPYSTWPHLKKNMFVLSTHENINLWGYLIVASFLH